MWQIQKTTNLLTRLIVTLVFVAQFLDTALASLSDKRLCADKKCKEIISLGNGKISYRAGEEGMVSFKINAPIRIKSKSAGKNPSLWGIEVNGREGYAPKELIKESKIIISEKNLKYEVDVVKPGSEPPVLNASENVVGQKDVLDGPTITTKPLAMIPVESNKEPIVKNPVENASSEKPASATPVLMEMVDGTQIPLIDDKADGVVGDLNEFEKIKQIVSQFDDDDDDYEIGDYDDDEEKDVYSDNDVKEIHPKILSSSIENSLIKTNETRDSTHEINKTETVSDKTNETNDKQFRLENIKQEKFDTNSESKETSTQSENNNEERKPIQIQDAITIENLPSSAVLNDANKIESEKIDANLPLIDLPHTSQQNLQIDIQSEQQLTKRQTESTLTTNENQINDNLKVPIDPKLTTTLKYQQQVPTEITKILEDKTLSDNTKETLITAGDQESTIIEHISNIENIPDNKTVEKENLSLHNQESLSNEEKLVSHKHQENNTEKSTERNETQINLESSSYPKPTTQTESNLTEQLDSGPATLPTPKYQEQTTEPSQSTTETPFMPKTEIPETSTASPINIPSSALESESYQHSSPETPSGSPATLPSLKYQEKTELVFNVSEPPQTTAETPLKPETEIPRTSTASPINIPSSTLESETYQHSSTETPSSAVLNNDLYQHSSPETPSEIPQTTTETPSTPETEIPRTSTASPINIPSSTLESETYQHSSTETPSSAVLNNDLYQHSSPETPSEIPQTTTETPSTPETEIPRTSTASPINIPSSTLESETYQHSSTETPPSSPATLPSLKYQEKTTELVFNVSEPPQTTTETPLKPETEIPQTSTASPINIPSSTLESETYQHSSTETPSSAVLNNDLYQHQTDNVNPTPYNPYDDAPSNTPLPPQYDNVNHESLSPSSSSSPITEIPQYDYYEQQATGYAPSDYVEHEVVTKNPIVSHHDQSSVSVEIVTTTPEPPKSVEEGPKALPSLTTPFNEDIEIKENKGLFSTIMGTVNNMLSSNKRAKHEEHNEKDDLHKILFPSGNAGHKIKNKNEANNIQYCEKVGPNGDCPHSELKVEQLTADCDCFFTKSIFNADLTFDSFVQALASKILEISELLAFLGIVAAASIFFIFGYYCFCNSSREGALLSKLNQLESSLLATHKENAILKHNLMSTRQKLASIEDNSFGSNDMVVSLKTELEEELVEKARLQEQITNLQKELENAADAGIELNKIVSELLSNQTGDESIISSVEELQKQLNEQQHTILEINSSLAEKSRENSELQLLIAEQNARYESEIANLQRDNDELEQEKGNLQTRLEEIRSDFDKDITVALEGKNFEIKRLQNEIVDLSNKLDTEHNKWQTSMAKVEALEECLKNVKRDPNVNITQVIDVANIRAELLDAQKKYSTLKERLEIQLDSRKLAENQLQIASAEVEKLKQDFNQSEKDKLEAQTRLEVLSNYFKDKENQLQKELSLKEAMWLKQQGETTTTVDRLTAMQEEIQSLKSQNDSLRAEIEAQVAAHKAQTGTLENRAHETWLAARQSDRRYEEARAEATAFRRKLTALAGGNLNEANKPTAGSAVLGEELINAPSPIHLESPGSPMLGRMILPPFLPPFMGPPPPFMGMPPPPPFVPPGEMRPAPLGRIMSPPPQRSGRFSPPHLDYEDYMDYEGNNTWHRHTYSPPPRTYRSLSPSDSRYDYGNEPGLMSTYDTETDFSPPPSPRESRRRGGGGNGSERGSNNIRSPYGNSKKSNSGNKGPSSSASEKSYNSSSHHGGKSKGGNTGVGKSLV